MAEGGEIKSPSYERQGTEELEDLPLKIPVSSIYDHFQCPICMSRMVDGCCMTTCGHRFCFKCIEEWVDRQHECPCCKRKLKSNDLIRDTGFDALLSTVKRERRVAEKEYFRKLVDDVCDQPFKGESSNEKIESPLQVVLQKHLKLSLQQHESYHQQLIADYRKGLSKISREKTLLAQQININFQNPDHPERLTKLADLESKWEEKKSVLDGELEKIEKLLAGTFDRYLTENLPPPYTMPLNITLMVPERNFTCDVSLKPEDSMETILKKLKTEMEKKDMCIVEFPACEEFEVSIISPFAPLDDNPDSTSAEKDSLKEVEGMTLVSQVVHPDCRPVLEFGIKTGTEIRLQGKIVLDCDVADLCFAATFVSGQGKSMNYFTCKNCNMKWVCHPCATVCHKGHEVTSFIQSHKPTWACCRCPKSKKCGLQK